MSWKPPWSDATSLYPRASSARTASATSIQAGQSTAFGLLTHGGYLGVVGYTPRKVEIRLSNLMAFDATARGNWGSAPERYPEALEMVLNGDVVLGPFIDIASLDEAPEVLQAVAGHKTRRRMILVPGPGGPSRAEEKA